MVPAAPAARALLLQLLLLLPPGSARGADGVARAAVPAADCCPASEPGDEDDVAALAQGPQQGGEEWGARLAQPRRPETRLADASETALDMQPQLTLEALRALRTSPPGNTNWDLALESLVQEIERPGSPESEIMKGLHAYAREQVQRNMEKIRANVEAQGLDAIDLDWPGNGYNEAAYGGQFEVLSLLEGAGVLRVGKIMGASGGASSTVLALADNQSSGHEVLLYNIAYVKAKISAVGQILKATDFWSAVYRRALMPESAFSRVKNRSYAVCARRQVLPSFLPNTAFSNYSTREQAVAAAFASGDASVHGALVGTAIPGLERAGSFLDGGQPTHFPDSRAALLWFNAFFGFTVSTTVPGVAESFRGGVDQTVRALTSPGLDVPTVNGVGGVHVVRPGPSGGVTAAEFGAIPALYGFEAKPDTHFWDVGAARETAPAG